MGEKSKKGFEKSIFFSGTSFEPLPQLRGRTSKKNIFSASLIHTVFLCCTFYATYFSIISNLDHFQYEIFFIERLYPI